MSEYPTDAVVSPRRFGPGYDSPPVGASEAAVSLVAVHSKFATIGGWRCPAMRTITIADSGTQQVCH